MNASLSTKAYSARVYVTNGSQLSYLFQLDQSDDVNQGLDEHSHEIHPATPRPDQPVTASAPEEVTRTDHITEAETPFSRITLAATESQPGHLPIQSNTSAFTQ